MGSSPPWSRAWVIGGSTGIGRDVALLLARRGVATTVAARSREKLAEVAAEATGISTLELDVAEAAATRSKLEAQMDRDGAAPDLVVLCAATWHPMGAKTFDASKFAQSFDVNVVGIANCLAAVMPAMIARRKGHIAIVSSVAGYRGLPNAAAYGPTKAALINLAESLEPDLRRFGVTLSIVNPGFVDTPMTRVNKFPMPFILTSGEAARRIVSGLERRHYEIAFPWQMVAFLKLARIAPNRLFLWYVRRFILPGS
ncbi:MAG: SDR family NAD(P)-dependent oxidoreductase [Hyphomicrobium sp.]|nr:SDR family NAD(P)-dependent oxidoreductase [Hyphomicrobium sp.]